MNVCEATVRGSMAYSSSSSRFIVARRRLISSCPVDSAQRNRAFLGQHWFFSTKRTPAKPLRIVRLATESK